MEERRVIGLMSGTSLDGLDLAYCNFQYSQGWTYELIVAKTIPYNDHWKNILRAVTTLPAEELLIQDLNYGRWLGEQVLDFISTHQISPDAIVSHGHTIFIPLLMGLHSNWEMDRLLKKLRG